MQKYFNILHGSLILEEKINKNNFSYFVLLHPPKSTFKNTRLRLSYSESLLSSGLYVKLTEELFNQSVSINVTSTSLELSLNKNCVLLFGEYKDRLIFDKDDLIDFYIDITLFSNDEITYLRTFIK